ncbi:25535_t:CDS:2 [Gigaspora margarita]|uniref:25535_t:CDS:1 n=1 Tax=Gigaspora margarita TaxID=4874 RepID=A0ABM8VYV5_GIGMA|nr:25535_t:CDS:2 [Gigaspora margarita]
MENSVLIEKPEDTPMTTLVIDKDDWKWPCFEEWYDDYYDRMERRVKIESININPFVAIYPRGGKPYVEVSSPKLIEILKGILPNKKISDEADEDNPKYSVGARELFHVMEELKNITSSITDLESVVNVKRLIRFLEQEFKQTIKAREIMITHKKVSYEMLWVFYTEKVDVWYRCELSGQQVGGIIASVTEKVRCGRKVFVVTINVIKYDGVGFKRCHVVREIDQFDGDVNFSDLPVVPFKLSTSEDFLKESIIANGKQYFKLTQGNQYMNYEGPLLRVRNAWIEKIRADGRVMIDIQSFSTMNPDYPMGDANPPNKCDIKMLKEKNNYLQKGEIDQDANYFLAPAVVYGFSFTLKEWGLFEVSKFSNIIFDSDALDHIVMSQNKKNMLEGLVSQYRDPAQSTDCNGFVNGLHLPEKSLDPITNKGNGCIFLCYGPPGTGKTLTAQSVAEHLKLPLWILTVRELGSTPESNGINMVTFILSVNRLETELVKILDIAYTWKAVILLDEADIYLEKRTTIDLIRNTMVGIFLRLLEYYQGVIFLTTNRVITFDDAICSRVNMFLHYPKLGQNDRRQIWSKFIKRANLPIKADEFSDYDLNGREIRNVLHAARLLAKNKGKELTAENVVDRGFVFIEDALRDI